jgi:hypothetical protein
VRNSSPLSKESSESISVNGVSSVSGNSFLLLLSLEVDFPYSHAGTIQSESLLKIKESLNATIVLVFNLLQVENVSFLFLDSFNELVNVGLFLVAVDLVILFVLNDVSIFHKLVFFKQV